MLHTIAWISIALALCSALIIAIDELRRPQAMAIMNIVWPVTALYGSLFALWAYFAVGVTRSASAMKTMQQEPPHQPATAHAENRNTNAPPTPTRTQVALATSHCGAGCTIADLFTEFILGALGITLFGLTLWASFVYDFIVAWTLGIVFQYFSIQPMRHLPPTQAILAAIKADTLSITAFQIGMYAWMSLVFFVLFPKPHLTPFDPRYWLMMQIAMILGYLTAYPMNRWLVRSGLKEAM